jgi:hypothetical protein
MHLETIKNLKIKESKYLKRLGIHGERGLYAFTRKKKKRLFKENQVICNYNGELINKNELEKRYGDNTGPYAILINQNNKNRYEDAAVERGIGSLINHSNSKRAINCLLKTRNKRISLVATKNILNGSELITTYGDEYKFDEDVGTTTNSRVKSL